MAQSSRVTKYASDGFSQVLANVLEERLARIKQFVEEDKACPRDELARFVWGTARSVRSTIKPEDASDTRRRDAWQAAKGMLKELIDFDKFRPQQFNASCVKNVLEKKTAEVIDNYRVYVLTGEIRTRWFPPKLLGETDEILCIDKPCLYTCTYGGNADDNDVPKRANAESASALLNGEKGEIQIHEYLALKFNYENAVGTREWWKKGETYLTCKCGACAYCACTQSGCCNRLDKETSGVMICAKTMKGFGEIRRQFSSEHSIEKGGTEKYYFALVHGEVKLPKEEDKRSDHWKHSELEGRGRVEVTMKWSKEQHKSVAYDGGDGPVGSESPQWALTFYEPIAWFTDQSKERYTLVHVQIVTGRTHQIRFHLAEVGHSLVGDPTYGAPWADRSWAKRVFLHSYQTKFREPATLRWFEATSPLPPDLGQVLASLKLDRVKEPWHGEPYLSRRQHPDLNKFMKQYDPLKPLLFTNDQVVSAEAIAAAQGQMAVTELGQKGAQNGGQPQWSNSNGGWNKDSWNSNGGWNNSSWNQESWQDGGWKTGDWKAGGQEEVTQAAAAGKGEEEDEEDDWGGWQAGQPAQPAQPPPAHLLAAAAQAAQAAPAPEEPAAKRPRLEVPAGVAGQAPSTPPAAVTAPAPKGSWKRIESRTQAGIFYYFNDATGETQVEPPPPWEKRQSRSQQGVFYYWNAATNATSVEKPQV